jgi:hypothetical protein
MNAEALSTEVLRDLSRRASFVFHGRVEAVGKTNLEGVEPDDRMAMVRIDEVVVAPPMLGDLTGKTLTIYLESAEGVQANDQATFFATSWHYGRNIGVVEIGRTSTPAAELRQNVTDERVKEHEARLEARIRRAELIISGHVISTFRTERKDLPGLDEGVEWWEAEMWVGTVEKGRPPPHLHTFYPVGGDREWGPVPKSHPGQIGVWLLGPVSEPDEGEREQEQPGERRDSAPEAFCCTDQQLGEVSPPYPLSFEANVLRPPKLQHAVQRGDSNGHLGRLPPFGPRAQRVTDHALVAGDIGLHQGTPIVTGGPLPAHAAALGDQLQVAGRASSARSLRLRSAPRSNVAAQ